MVRMADIFEAVIGSGDAHSIKDWADYSFRRINKNWQDYVKIIRNFVPEYKILVSNPAVIKSLGWQPKINFWQLADLMMGDI